MFISIKGAQENNLKMIDVQIPKNKLVVFTGLSGSGKSTLALETLQRECQRQYMESMGMTLDMGSKPKVGSIEGLSPAISINQHQTNNNPRSTVGTITEVTAYLRILFSKLAQDPDSGTEMVIEPLTANHFSYNKPEGACPTCHGIGVVNFPQMDLLMDFSKSIQDGAISGWDQAYIQRYGGAMTQASIHYGFQMRMDLPIETYGPIQKDLLLYGVLSRQFQKHFPDIVPPKTVPQGRFEGVVTNLLRRYADNTSQSARKKIEKLLIQQECPECKGLRFKDETLKFVLTGKNIYQALSMSLQEASEWLKLVQREISPESFLIVQHVLQDVEKKIRRIIDAGAGYLRLDQPAGSLSAGEWQRIKLASVLGSGLTGVLYVLDEPTSGLHSRDTAKVVSVLKRLRDLGNTVLVIEHDMAVMKAADHLVDFGPGAGREGGQIVAQGAVEDLIKTKASITGRYLNEHVYTPKREKILGNDGLIAIRNATVNNLKSVTLDIPLGRMVAVTGVSGSGKSSLIFGYLAKAAERYFQHGGKDIKPEIVGMNQLDGFTSINQQSIGRSSRSNAATYTEIFTDIRDLFASLPETKSRGFKAKHFSYNVHGGRCEKCQGAGKLSISMHFLPDVEIICPVCDGRRYMKPILEISYKNHSISDVLDLSIDQALNLFSKEQSIAKKLTTLEEVGLGYLILGQSTSTLSGGEAQRLKLAKELMKAGTGKILYLFDEPTNGLHPHDVGRLIKVLDRLVKKGNSVLVIEHHAEMIAEADWIIDIGPEGGNAGGEIIAQGDLMEILKCKNSHTGTVLSQTLSLERCKRPEL